MLPGGAVVKLCVAARLEHLPPSESLSRATSTGDRLAGPSTTRALAAGRSTSKASAAGERTGAGAGSSSSSSSASAHAGSTTSSSIGSPTRSAELGRTYYNKRSTAVGEEFRRARVKRIEALLVNEGVGLSDPRPLYERALGVRRFQPKEPRP
jgi:hypothetical protein